MYSNNLFIKNYVKYALIKLKDFVLFYLLQYLLFYPIFKFISFFRKPSDKILIIQTAKIGDYANSTIIFEPLSKFDILLDEINVAFAKHDNRIDKIFIINDIKKKKTSKLRLAITLFKQNYKDVYVLMPNSLNLFLARCTLAKNIVTIKHYATSSSFELLAFGMKKISHTLNDLTLLTYLKMIGVSELKFEKQLQKPLLAPSENIIKSNKFKIGISLSAGNKMKTPPNQTWEKILKIFSKFDCEIYVFGVGDENRLLEKLILECEKRNSFEGLKFISMIDKIKLEELPFYLSQMQLYISSDTGNYYVADSVHTPTICLMGPCFASEQRGVFDSLVINSTLAPISSVFKTVRNIDASSFFELSDKDLEDIERFTKDQLYILSMPRK